MDNDWKRLLEAYPPEKKAWDHTYPWIAYILRPTSFPTSYILHKLSVTANMVTVFTALLGIAALPLLASGNRTLMVWGGLCILLYNWLDCVDGNLARAWPAEGPPVGKFWDQMVGNFYPLSYLFLGVGLQSRAALLLGAFITVEKFLIHAVRHIYWDVLGDAWISKKNAAAAPAKTHSLRWYYKLYYNLTDLQAHAFLLPLLIFLDCGGLFVWVSFVMISAETAITLVLYLWRSVRLKKCP